MEDFEKKYNDSLRVAENWLNNERVTEDTKKCIQCIFPELAESYDEKIRKTLIHIVKGACDKYGIKYRGDKITEEKLLAYLEKQKIVPVQTEKERIYIRTLQGLISDFLRDHDGQANQEFYQECWDWLECRHIDQQPAEWSLTDATFIEEIDETLFMAETGRNEVVKNQIEQERNWLKNLPKRFNLQPKQEWSEEDKRAIDRACVALRAYSNGDIPEFLPSELLGYADRLQSLRPQPHWKPSEEQVSILAKVFAGCELNTPEKDSMVDLLNHLKDMI